MEVDAKENQLHKVPATNGGDQKAANPQQNISNFSANGYATHKTITTGVMNVGLLTSNVNQIKLICKATNGDVGSQWDGFQTTTVVLLAISIVLQIACVILSISMAASKVNIDSVDAGEDQGKKSLHKRNTAVSILVAFITIINIIASSLSDSA